MKQGKVWGTTTEIIKTPFFEAHIAHILPNHECSKHFHRYKHNMFFILSGTLQINVWSDYGLVDKTVLKAGEKMSVPPNIKHQFQTGSEPCVCLELYWPEWISGVDIARETVGRFIGKPTEEKEKNDNDSV